MERIVNDTDVRFLVKKNEMIAAIFAQYGQPPAWCREPGFITLSKLILEQQVSLASARAHFIKLNSYIPSFTPAEILKLSVEELRACQISRQKATYLRELSLAITSRTLDLEKLPRLSDAEIRRHLTNIKGIGNWTTDVYLMFCLQAKDIFPIGDVAVVNTIRELTGLQTREEIIAFAERWRPLRSLATYFLWHHYLEKRQRKAGGDMLYNPTEV